MHLATSAGVKIDKAYQEAYWKAFDEFFGPANAAVVKSMLLTKVKRGDSGTQEHDRVCLGLRQTMAWLAEAIERKAMKSVNRMPTEPPARRKRG